MNFELLFDNGGGILLLTDNYCHAYERPTWAADDAAKLLDGANTEDWDGNEPEYRCQRHPEDDAMSMSDAQNIYGGESWEEKGAAWNEFCRELVRLGGLSKFIFTAGNHEDIGDFETCADADARAKYLAECWEEDVTVRERYDRSNTWVAEYVPAVQG